MKVINNLMLVTLFVSVFNLNAQNIFYDSINNEKYILIDVAKTYERMLTKGYYSLQMLEFLGNYYYVSDKEKSKKYYDILFKKYDICKISDKSIEQYNNLKI